MKITFINPKTTAIDSRRLEPIPPKIEAFFKNNSFFQKKMEYARRSFSALGLLTIAGVVPDDFELEFLDENMEEVNFDRHFDLVAIGGNLDQMNRALMICDILKKKNTAVIAGGPAVMTFPDLFTRKGISVVLGEGERLFKIFLKDFLKNKSRLIYDNTIAPAHVDLKDSPAPRFDLAAQYRYSMIGVHIARGCPYNCNFCQVTRLFGNQYRYKTVDNIVKEIKLVKKYWPDNFFLFYSDNPFANRQFALELFDRLFNKENIDLGRWGALANISLYKDEELLDILTARGPVAYLGIGFESLSQRSLDTINNKMKLHHLHEYKKAIDTFKKKNINPVGYFMFGFENSEPQEIEDILNFIRENKIYAEFRRLTPLPGTALYKRLKREYESKYGKVKRSSLSEWGRINNYLKEKSGLSETRVQKYLLELYEIIFSDRCYVDADFPSAPLF